MTTIHQTTVASTTSNNYSAVITLAKLDLTYVVLTLINIKGEETEYQFDYDDYKTAMSYYLKEVGETAKFTTVMDL